MNLREQLIEARRLLQVRNQGISDYATYRNECKALLAQPLPDAPDARQVAERIAKGAFRTEPVESFSRHVLDVWDGSEWNPVLTDYSAKIISVENVLKTAIQGNVEAALKDAGWSQPAQEPNRAAEAWKQTAEQHCRNEEWLRSLLVKCASHLGPEVYECDDGTVSQDPLITRVPELVGALAQQVTPNDGFRSEPPDVPGEWEYREKVRQPQTHMIQVRAAWLAERKPEDWTEGLEYRLVKPLPAEHELVKRYNALPIISVNADPEVIKESQAIMAEINAKLLEKE